MLKLTFRLIVLLLLIVFAILAWIIGTHTGTAWTLKQAENQLDSLKIDGLSGRLYDDLRIERLEFKDKQTLLQATNLQTAWDLSCLLNKTLCLNNISLAHLKLSLPPAVDEKPAAEGEKDFSIPALPLQIKLSNASIDLLEFTQGESTHVINNIALSATTDASSINLSHASLEWDNNKAQLQAVLKLTEHYPLEADLSLTVPELLGPETTTLSLQAEGPLKKSLNVEAQLQGHQRAKLKASVAPLAKPIELQGLLQAELLQSPAAESESVKLQNLRFDFEGDLEELLFTTHSTVTVPQIPENTVDISAKLVQLANLEDLQLTVNALSGKALLQGQVGWKDNISWQLKGNFKDLDLALLRDDLEGQVSGTLASTGHRDNGEFLSPQTSLNLDGTLLGRPLDGTLDLSLNKGQQIELRALELHSGSNQLTASGEVAEHIDISADLDAADLASLWPGLGGQMHGTVRATGTPSLPNIEADLQGQSLAYASNSAEQLSLKATVRDGASAKSALVLSARGLESGGIREAQLDAEIQGTLSAHQALIEATTKEQIIGLKLMGSLDNSDWHGSLEQAELAHQALKLELQSPFDIAWLSQSSQAHIASHCWLHEEARLCLDEDATLSAEQGQAALSLKNLSLQKFNPLLPETAQLAGTLATDIRSEWRGGALPTADLKAHVSELALSAKDADGQPISVIFDQAQIDAELGENQGKLDLLLHSQEQGKTQIKANLDPATRALSGTVNLEGFLLGPLKALLPMLDTLRGEISASGEFSGTVDDPKFKGQVRLKNPAVAGSQVPLTVEDGQLKLDIDGRSATLNAEFITAPSGTLRISGDAKYTDKLRANIALDGEELALLLPPTIDATINHSLTLAYDAEQLKLRGKIHIPDAVIVLEGMSGSGPSLSKDMVLTDPEDRPAQGDKQDTALQIDMDLQAQIDDEVRLSGYGFDTRLKGDIKVRQRIGQPPQLAGQLELKDGQYQAYGQDLAVRRGELLFVGPMRSTRVDVTAVRVVDDVEAGLELGGDLISPQVTLFSEPAMADADILSYIVLGGPPGAGGDESAMLARAALGLGLKNGNHIAGQFASAAGIEDFNIGADGQGEDTAVVLSGRLSPKLLLSYRMSIFDAANTLTARYDLSQALYLELMRGVEQAIDLIYSVDY